MRNAFFDLRILPSYLPKIKTIAIGNLSTGGTGKTPFVEMLIRELSDKHKIAVLSRGYGRNSKGFKWVEVNSNAFEVGDEALQVKTNFPEITVAVCEKRADGIKIIERDKGDINLILLDDAFQHRYVTAQLYILLSSYNKPFYGDYILPMGNLREWRNASKRADFIVITKCKNFFALYCI